MNLRVQRTIDRLLGIPICALFSLVDFFRGDREAIVPFRRILVILLSEMGSLVLAYPMFVRLKQRYPGALIYVLLFARNREALDLLGVVPKVNILTLDDSSATRFTVDIIRTVFRLLSLRFDVVIDCELFARVSSVLSYCTGAPIRVGFHRHTQEGLYRGSFINRPVMYNPYRHLSRQFLAMVAAVESKSVPIGKFEIASDPVQAPTLVFEEEELRRFRQQLHTDFPAIKDRKLVFIYPSGGVLPIRAWPLEHYKRLSFDLLDDGYAVGVIGLPGDKPLGQAIVAHGQTPRCIDLTGYTKSVRHLLALFHLASLLITNDGGPGQLAALTHIPSIILFGPETPVLYRSLTKNAYSIHLSLPCSPCLTAYNHRTSPCDGDNQCLKQITPEQVLAKAREMLGALPVPSRQ